MQINVTVNKVEIIDENTINKGEYNIHTCEFTFANEYNGLIKRAVFTANKSYYVEINLNNICIIPEEVLQLQGNVTLGVYAYENNENNELQLRYSPEPTKFFVNNGSYVANANSTIPEGEATDLIKRVNDIVAEVQKKIDNGDFDGVGISNITFTPEYTMIITLTDGRVITSQSLKGEKGDRGIQGETGNGIASVVLNNDYTLTINFTDGTAVTTASIRGQAGYTPQKRNRLLYRARETRNTRRN